MAKHNILGQKGEEEAKLYLEAHGYKIIELNWTHHCGDEALRAGHHRRQALRPVATGDYPDAEKTYRTAFQGGQSDGLSPLRLPV